MPTRMIFSVNGDSLLKNNMTMPFYLLFISPHLFRSEEMKKDVNEGRNDSAKIIERQLRELSRLAEMNKKIHSTMSIDGLLQNP